MLMFTQYCGTTRYSFSRRDNGGDSNNGGGGTTDELGMPADVWATSDDEFCGEAAAADGTNAE